jgi:hypothetical protein
MPMLIVVGASVRLSFIAILIFLIHLGVIKATRSLCLSIIWRLFSSLNLDLDSPDYPCQHLLG